MSTWYKYRVFCETDNKYEYVYGETEPTKCPTDTSHSITSSKTCVIEERDEKLLRIQEEYITTGGNFATSQIKVVADANTTVTQAVSWPHPISALIVNFTTDLSHVGNTVDMSVGKNTIIGVLTNATSTVSSWTSQNYVAGDKVTYTDNIGNRVYTCIVSTVSNELPTNKAFWQLGYELNVSSTALSDKTMVGYYLRLDDLTVVNNDVGRIIAIDRPNKKIYVEKHPTNEFTKTTYIKQTVYILKNYEIDIPWEHDIGQSKIGGVSIPTDTLVTIDYTNNTTTRTQVIGRVEYIY